MDFEKWLLVREGVGFDASAVPFIKACLEGFENRNYQPFLIFADYLEEHGNELSILIRNFMELRTNPKGRIRQLKTEIRRIMRQVPRNINGIELTSPISNNRPLISADRRVSSWYVGRTKYEYFPNGVSHRISSYGGAYSPEEPTISTIPPDTLLVMPSGSDQTRELRAKWDIPYEGNIMKPQSPEVFIGLFYNIMWWWFRNQVGGRV